MSNQKLPDAFVKRYRARANEIRFLGKSVTDLSRDELLAVTAMLIGETERLSQETQRARAFAAGVMNKRAS